MKRRLSLWKYGQLDQLMFEGKTIQNNDRATTNKNIETLTFPRLVDEEGIVHKSIKILEKANKEGILPHSDEMFEILYSENIPRLLKHQMTYYKL